MSTPDRPDDKSDTSTVAPPRTQSDLEAKLEWFVNQVRSGSDPVYAFMQADFEWGDELTLVAWLQDSDPGARRPNANEHALATFAEFDRTQETVRRIKASGDPDTVSGMSHDKALDSVFQLVANSLEAYSAGENWPLEGGPRATLPRPVGRTAYFLVKDLISGRIPPMIQRLYYRRGTSSASSVERWAIEDAVTYFFYCKAKGIPGATKRIHEAYGVTRQGVNKWVRIYRPDDRYMERLFSWGDEGEQFITESLFRSAQIYRRMNGLQPLVTEARQKAT